MAYIGNSPGVASQRVVTNITATAGQTVFTPISGYTLGYVEVYQNGLLLVNGTDYTADDGQDITFAQGANLDDDIQIVAYQPRGLTDGYTKAEADARYEPIDSAYTKSEADSRYATSAQGSTADSAVQPGDLSTVATSGAYADLSGKPTNVSSFTNDSGYATTSYVDTAESDAVATANNYTNTRETAITTAYRSYADSAEADAITAANNYTDSAVANVDALPSQSGNSGKYLTTDGSTASWGELNIPDAVTSDVHVFYTDSNGDLIWEHGAEVTDLQDADGNDLYDLVIVGSTDQTYSVNQTTGNLQVTIG